MALSGFKAVEKLGLEDVDGLSFVTENVTYPFDLGEKSSTFPCDVALILAGTKVQKVIWPSISNALTGVRAKEISKSRFPVFPNFLGLVLGCIEAKFCK